MLETKRARIFVYEAPQLLFELIDPVYSVQTLERRVLHGAWNVWQCVEGQELRCLRKFSSLRIQVHLEVCLSLLEVYFNLLLVRWLVLSPKFVHRMVDEHYKVNS